MNNYKKWTGEERKKSLVLFNKAVKMGLIPRPTKCRICGQTEGILQTHNEDYDATLNYIPKMIDGTATEEEKAAVFKALVPICWRCHMMHHSRWISAWRVEKYFKEVKSGKMYPPVFNHDFGILKRDHGIDKDNRD